MRYLRKAKIGLIYYLPKWCSQLRCDRCDLLLMHSVWKSVIAFYSKSIHTNRGYICIQCALRPRRNAEPRVTPEEIDAFARKYPEYNRKYIKKHKKTIKVPIITQFPSFFDKKPTIGIND